MQASEELVLHLFYFMLGGKMKRLIVTDLDGTLLNDEKEISLETKEVLIEQQEKGAMLVLASGRTVYRMMKYAKELNMDKYGGYLIEANGAALYDFKKNERRILGEIDKKEAFSIYNFLKKKYSDFEIIIMADEHVYLDRLRQDSILLKDKNIGKGVNFVSFTDLSSIKENIYKIALCNDIKSIEKIRNELELDFKDKYSVALMMPNFLELSKKEFSKGKALSLLMEQFNYSKEDTYVFGDNENDLSMFECGQAVAMANATDWIKKHTDYVTLSNTEDGIACFLKRKNLV